MLIDFEPVIQRQRTLFDFANRFGPPELKDMIAGYVAFTRQVIEGVNDEQLLQIPEDLQADDPFAAAEEDRHIGWSLAHLVLHVTASAEEGAAFSSILARGITIGGRLRYEDDWRQVRSRAEVLERLEECQRMCLAYLETWPARPHLETLRILSGKLSGMKVNALTSYVWGLYHWHQHVEQFKKVAEQVTGASRSEDEAAKGS